MSSRVQDGVEEHRVGQLAMEPEILIERQPLDLRPDPPHDGPANWQQNKHSVETENQSSTARDPDGKHEQVQRSQALIGLLFVPIYWGSAHVVAYN